ncbi:DUF6443 domain-containing protein, partial [Soonwooa sp.]|uniref:DUF6443 domain-containing protein n=1 Tax=Soonwooa sp. TaxID=1938592 RepID=UPI00289D1015
MLPGFHANSNDGNYNSASFRAIVGGEDETTSPPVVHTPSTGENYVYSRTYLYPTTTSNAYVPQVQNITYYDGLGRPKQSIAIKASPTGEDLVTPIPYDGFGRQVDSWLPAPMSSLNGSIQTSPESTAVGFHGNAPYSHKTLENSPLDRIQSLTQPGTAWQNNPINYAYEANNSNEVFKFTTSTIWVNDASKSELSLASDIYYPAATLYKNKVIDEDSNVSYEFKNGEGQTLLVRKMNGSDALDTYYVYNEYNQLAYVLPPLAVQEIKTNISVDKSDGSNLLTNLCYIYRYDGHNRLVEKKLPGKGWEYMVYDKADRLILTQDAKLREINSNRWLMTKYDKFGRVAYAGFITDSNRASMQNQIKDLVIIEDQKVSGFSKSGLQVEYSNNFFTSFDTLLSVNYYDSYPTSVSAPSSSEVYNQPLLTSNYTASQQNPNALVSTRGLPTASLVKNIDDNRWTKTYTFYDQKARPVYTHSINHLGGYTKTASLLDFSGVTIQSRTEHKRNASIGAPIVTVNERFVYDSQNRLKQHCHQVDGGSEELLADNTYDKLGRLANKKLGNNLQSVDYSYNIRGWMTGINANN